ncbi:MAG: choline/ethanolamine kinase family protein [Pseudohongiellaceae bacterium]
MAKELSPTDRLKHTLAQWQSWQARLTRRPDLVGDLNGKSNDTFLVAGGNEQFVVRINSPAHRLGVDRTAELQILTDIAAREYAPSVVFASEEILVTRYVTGGHPQPDQCRSWLDRAGRLFRTIHTTPTRVTTILDPLQHAINYCKAIENPDRLITACLEKLLQRPQVTPDDVCLCHNDLLFENIISNTAGWVAIDWEYASLGDPAFDLAVLVETIDADDSELEILLDAYGSQHPRDRINYYRDLYRLIEIMWWRLKSPDEPSLPGLTELATRLDVTAPV